MKFHRFYRFVAMLLMLTVLLSLISIPAFAYGDSFTLYNMSGRSISEVYVYPEYSSNWGKIRNGSWIYNNSKATIQLTSSEARLNTKWCIRIGISNGKKIQYWWWEDVDISRYINGGTVTLMSNSSGGYTLDFGSDDNYYNGNTFRLCNMTGEAMNEIYFYPEYNTVWGDCRIGSILYNGHDTEIYFYPSEVKVNTLWKMTIGFKGGYATWDDIDIQEMIESGYITITKTATGYLCSYD